MPFIRSFIQSFAQFFLLSLSHSFSHILSFSLFPSLLPSPLSPVLCPRTPITWKCMEESGYDDDPMVREHIGVVGDSDEYLV